MAAEASDAWFNVLFAFSLLVAGDKPHGCDICLKKFALACNLRAHMKTHEGLYTNNFNQKLLLDKNACAHSDISQAIKGLFSVSVSREKFGNQRTEIILSFMFFSSFFCKFCQCWAESWFGNLKQMINL